jgi:hypothetical protein
MSESLQGLCKHQLKTLILASQVKCEILTFNVLIANDSFKIYYFTNTNYTFLLQIIPLKFITLQIQMYHSISVFFSCILYHHLFVRVIKHSKW